ncbi:hypothetical protein V5T82_01535 [Magnetovibrio sp. PR-2]|uniref:hypothetical protein n=1 Tax=Magnetovibrio sp. PR-2 TaxID=3120356 RepID=UPI002FCE5BA4
MLSNQKTLASTVLSRTARRFAVLGAVLGASTLLSGCMTYMTQSVGAPMQSCLSDREDVVAEADWDNATTLDAKFVNGELRPMVLYVETNRPYILRVRNLDRENHSIWAPDFLKQGVALDTIQMDDKTPAGACVNGVRVMARSTVTFRFVPVWEGRYEVANSRFPMIPPAQLTDGVFHIIEPRVGQSLN